VFQKLEITSFHLVIEFGGCFAERNCPNEPLKVAVRFQELLLWYILCVFLFQDHLIFSHFTSNLRVKSQKPADHHGRRAATSPPSGSGRTTSYNTSSAALALGMPSTTISDCSHVRITAVHHHCHQHYIRSDHAVMISLRNGLFRYLLRPHCCPTSHQYVLDAIGMRVAASGLVLMWNTSTNCPMEVISVDSWIASPPSSNIQITPTVDFVERDHNNPQSVFGSRKRGVVFFLWVKWGPTLRWAFAFRFTCWW
jgi:hypothetical protein